MVMNGGLGVVRGEDPPESVRNALQVSVTLLPKVLRPWEVEIERVGDGDGYALRGTFRVDAADFEQAVAEGRAAFRTGDLARSVGLLTAAVDLWEGSALEGLDALPFTIPARVALDATRCAALVDSPRHISDLVTPGPLCRSIRPCWISTRSKDLRDQLEARTSP